MGFLDERLWAIFEKKIEEEDAVIPKGKQFGSESI